MTLDFDLAAVVNLVVNLVVMSLMGARLYYGLRAEIRATAQDNGALKEQLVELKAEVAKRKEDERLHDHEARIRILEMQTHRD